MRKKTWPIVLRLLITVLLIVLLVSSAIAGYLLCTDRFYSKDFSEGAFFAAIAFVVLAVTPIYDVLSSSNHVSYMYGEYAVKGRIDASERIADILSKKSYRFSVIMVLVGVLLFCVSALSDKLF